MPRPRNGALARCCFVVPLRRGSRSGLGSTLLFLSGIFAVQSAAEAYIQLKKKPEFRRLLSIARSDNPLIALGVTKREISWTKFQAWLLDPVRQPGKLGRCFVETLLGVAVTGIGKALQKSTDSKGTQHLKALSSLVPFSVSKLVSARAEVREGRKGRSDLVVTCIVDRKHVTILIENKIEATESEDQLSKYVKRRLKLPPTDGLLLPILIELGDDAIGESTCPWAVCWGRTEAAAWLSKGAAMCKRSGINVPSLVGQYRQVFKAWDLAASFKRRARQLIERTERGERKPSEWALVRDWLRIGDVPFFREVARNARLTAALRKHGFLKPETEAAILGRNDVLGITKKSWTLPIPGPTPETVNVHFESRHRGEVRLDIGIEPYRGGIGKDPQRMKALARHLKLKTELFMVVRPAIRGLDNHRQRLGINLKGLRRVERTDAHTAVKFDVGLGRDCTPLQHARHMADVVETITPVIDDIVRSFGIS